MTSRMTRTVSVGDSLCPVCHEESEIYAFGPCDHPICYRCSTRMRVLCDQMYCPICRGDLPQIVFLTAKSKYDEVNRRNCIPNRKYKILLEDESVEDAFHALQEHHCKVCDKSPKFDNFKDLQRHMARLHQLFPCKLCVDHLKLFTFERKFYNRKDLARHCRSGDPDNRSYRGHPQCEFCSERYMDKDELLRHLRKNHYYCHFCDTDNSNEYFNEYQDLKVHFRNRHFLCQEGECGLSATQFTHAFNSDIDLKAHVATEHFGNKSRAQVKEMRTLDVNFQVAPRRRGRDAGVVAPEDFEEVSSSGRGPRDRRHRRYDNRHDELPQQDRMTPPPAEVAPVPIARPPASDEDFPTLGNAPTAFVSKLPQSTEPVEHFPSLSTQRPSGPGSKSAALAATSTASSMVKKKGNRNHKPVNNFTSIAVAVSKADMSRPSSATAHPSLPSPAPARPFTAATAAPRLATDDFPTLGGSKKSKAEHGPNRTSLGVWQKKQKDSNTAQASSAKKEKPSQPGAKPVSLAALGRSLCDDREFPTLGDGSVASRQGGWVKKTAKDPKSANNKSSSAPLGNVRIASVEAKNSSTSEDNLQAGKVPGAKSEETKSKKKKKKQKETKEDSGISISSIVSETDNMMVDKESKANEADKEADKEENVSVLKNVSDNALSQTKSLSPLPLQSTAVIESTSAEEKENEDWEMVESRKSLAKPFKDEDFPTLMAAPKKTTSPPGFQKASEPPKTSAAPPGLSKPATSLSWGRTPPGLGATPLTPPATTFSGSNSSIPMSVKLHMYTYVPPPDSSERNKVLVQLVRQLLEVKPDGFDKFRAMSGEFRGGQMTAQTYYKRCQDLFGHERLLEVLPELIALLPDILKQHELQESHRVDILGICAPLSLTSCPTCHQLLKPKDLIAHLSIHTNLGSDITMPSFSLPVKS